MRNTRGIGFAAALVVLVAATPAGGQPPNVVLILVDDLGWMDLGCQGSSFYETPHIDTLASQGVRFTDAYANCPVCSPSRATLLTGQYPLRTGFTGHITAIGRHRYPPRGAIVPPDDYLFLRRELVTLAEALEPAGYTSASIGKWHLGSEAYWPRQQGFDVNIAGHEHGSPASYFFPYTNPDNTWNPDIPNLDGGREGEYLTDRLTDEAIGFVEAHRHRPFFLYLSHYAVHTPLQAPAASIAKYRAKLVSDSSQINAVYGAMVESVDRSVGRLLGALDRLKLSRNTLVVFTSDNGGYDGATRNRPLRSAKGHLFEGGIRVPLIIRWPGRIQSRSVCSQPVTLADLFPTVLEAAGRTTTNAPVDGRSLMPLLAGQGGWPSRDLFWYYPHYSPHGNRPGAVIRSGGYKLIQFYDPPKVELYDLSSDLGELRNLAAELPERTEAMRRRLEKWVKTGKIHHTTNPDYDPSISGESPR